MAFHLIDMATYVRREHYLHYAQRVQCSYSITADVDVTELIGLLKAEGLRFYPTFIHIVSTAVNNHREFRMAVDEQGRLGYHDQVSPEYLIFHDDDGTFSCAFTPYQRDFRAFYAAITADMAKYADVKGFVACPAEPNSFPVSCLPWLDYTGFNINLPAGDNFFAPIVTWERYVSKDGRLRLPLTIQIHHAVADGYHTALLCRDVRAICARPREVLLGTVTSSA